MELKQFVELEVQDGSTLKDRIFLMSNRASSSSGIIWDPRGLCLIFLSCVRFISDAGCNIQQELPLHPAHLPSRWRLKNRRRRTGASTASWRRRWLRACGAAVPRRSGPKESEARSMPLVIEPTHQTELYREAD